MNTKKLNFAKMMFCLSLLVTSTVCFAQNDQKTTIAVLNIDSKGLTADAQTVGYLVRLELEKTGVYSVMDRYEVADVVAKNSIDVNKCYSKSSLVAAGKLLGVSKMLGGSVELLDSKIVITLRVIDVSTGAIEKSDATEYLDIPELQKMIRVSVQKILGLTPDESIVSKLIDYDIPIQSPKNTLRLNGPRMGFAFTSGDAGKVLTAPTVKGGFDMFPVTFEFGWQQEFQYISSGNFQALVENIFLVSGLESGRLVPNYAPLLGFRFGRQSWEFAFGPTFRLIKKADGYYDDKGNWHLSSDWDSNQPLPSNYTPATRLDSRGNVSLSTGLVIGLGRTFHSGYLNIPVNLFVAPSRDGTTTGITFGFNVQKKDKNEKRQLRTSMESN